MNKYFLILAGLIVIAGLGVGGVKIYSKVRGIRNNNPLNIELGAPWQGLSTVQDDGRFCQFSDVIYGIRAAAKILSTYAKRGLNTIEKIVSSWAPPNENDTESYIDFVVRQTGFSRNKVINKSAGDYVPLLKAMIKKENGFNPYSDATIEQGISLV